MKDIILKFKGKIYKLPRGLMEIKYEQGQKIVTALKNDIGDEYMQQLWLVSAVLNIKPKELVGADPIQLNAAYQICMKLVSTCSVPLYDSIKVNKNYYKLKDLENLTVDDYFSIDNHYRNNPDNIINAGAQIVKQIYQPVETTLGIILKQKKVSRLFSISTAKSYFATAKSEFTIKGIELNINDLTAGYIASTYYNIMEYKRQMAYKYPILFKTGDEQQQQQEENDNTEDPTKQFGYTVPVSESWGWYDIINSVCGENKIEIDYWLTKPCEEFFTFLCYKIQKNKELNKTK